MEIKLTKAQKKLIENMKANPGSDAKEHLGHIRNQAIAEEMITRMLKFGILQIDQANGHRELSSTYKMKDLGSDEGYLKNTKINNQLISTTLKEKCSRKNKKALLLNMLQKKVSLTEMVTATGWEAKSVRGVISQLKKEKNLRIFREKNQYKENFYYVEA